MFGAIAGDIIGSVYDFNNYKGTDFSLFESRSCFTDDSVLTVAVADCIMNNGNYSEMLKEYGRRFPNVDYGGWFFNWIQLDSYEPYNSFGNGSAMRVSPVGFAYDTLDEVMEEAKRSSEATHNHPEGIKGAQVTATAIFLARKGKSKSEIKKYIYDQFDYDLSASLDEIRKNYSFDVSCQGSVPQAITAFLESNSFEDAIRKAVSIGGDSDTIACITGGIAQAFYKEIPSNILEEVEKRLDEELLDIAQEFDETYCQE